jgi:NAD(P)-dependent dehydrogenase (short-subunit alcohol dehydrogenase family)
MLATQLALDALRAGGGGAVVNIASSAGIWWDAYDSPEYGAAKAGLIRFTTTLVGLRESMGVRVNWWCRIRSAWTARRPSSPR